MVRDGVFWLWQTVVEAYDVGEIQVTNAHPLKAEAFGKAGRGGYSCYIMHGRLSMEHSGFGVMVDRGIWGSDVQHR